MNMLCEAVMLLAVVAPPTTQPRTTGPESRR